ncbi:MAG: hypothetical protein ACI8SE_001840, partial [Bacteroidia bacterium]
MIFGLSRDYKKDSGLHLNAKRFQFFALFILVVFFSGAVQSLVHFVKHILQTGELPFTRTFGPVSTLDIILYYVELIYPLCILLLLFFL